MKCVTKKCTSTVCYRTVKASWTGLDMVDDVLPNPLGFSESEDIRSLEILTNAFFFQVLFLEWMFFVAVKGPVVLLLFGFVEFDVDAGDWSSRSTSGVSVGEQVTFFLFVVVLKSSVILILVFLGSMGRAVSVKLQPVNGVHLARALFCQVDDYPTSTRELTLNMDFGLIQNVDEVLERDFMRVGDHVHHVIGGFREGSIFRARKFLGRYKADEETTDQNTQRSDLHVGFWSGFVKQWMKQGFDSECNSSL